MPTGGRPTLTQFLIEERRRHPNATGELNALITDLSLACKAIAKRVAFGALAPNATVPTAPAVNVQGEEQKPLDVLSNQMFLRANEWGGHVAGMVSEEMEEAYTLPPQYPRGKYLLLFDPLDGSSNIDVNVSVGSIFSILRAPHPGQDARPEDFLQPGTQQIGAGYAIRIIPARDGRGCPFRRDGRGGRFGPSRGGAAPHGRAALPHVVLAERAAPFRGGGDPLRHNGG